MLLVSPRHVFERPFLHVRNTPKGNCVVDDCSIRYEERT